MSNGSDFDEGASRRTYTAPYTARHPVPTVQGYQETQEKREEATENTIPEVEDDKSEGGKLHGLLGSAKNHLHLNGSNGQGNKDHQPYSSTNRNVERPHTQNNGHEEELHTEAQQGGNGTSDGHQQNQSFMEELDPRKTRKNMKHMKRDHAPREVTDPVTHLPVVIHDSTNTELKNAPENVPKGGDSSSGSSLHLERQTQQEQAEHRGMEKLFPPPNFEAAREELTVVYDHAIMLGLGSAFAIFLVLLLMSHLISVGVTFKRNDSSTPWLYVIISSLILLLSGLVLGGAVIWGLQGWLKNKINATWDDKVWDGAKQQEKDSFDSPIPESVEWLNSVLSSLWSLINPDLFTSLADTLEDVMQASLPKMVRMISVEDLGQGSEAIRILGIRWLPRGAAAKDVSVDGKIKDGNKKGETDRKVPGEGEVEDGNDSGEKDDNQSNKGDKQQEGEDENTAEGLEAEEGDFVNVEVAFSYRASTSSKRLKDKAKNAHLFLAFYLPGKVRFREYCQSPSIYPSDESIY